MQTVKELSLNISGEELLLFISKGVPPLFYDKAKLFVCADFAGKIAKIKFTSNIFRISFEKDGVKVLGTNLLLKGNSIKEHLLGCVEVMVFAVTLGRAVDEAIARSKFHDLEYSCLLDSAAELLLDRAVEQINFELKTSLKTENKTTVSPFSPGYGDLPLDCGGEVLNILSAKKHLGILLSESLLMSPLKSITSIIGIKYDS